MVEPHHGVLGPDIEVPDNHVSGVMTGDEALLAKLGYKQELRREFSPFEVFGIGFSIIGLIPSIASVLYFSIPNGGAVAMVWGWAVCAFFLTFIALAIAELASSAPTSGGLYYWTYIYSTPKWRYLLSWIVGYANTICSITAVSSIDWGCALQVVAAASIGSGQTFVPTTGQTFGVYCALVVSHAVVCSLATRVIARLQVIYISLNILLILGIIIALPITTPHEFRNKAIFSFGNFQNFTTWPNGFAFVLSFLAPLWSIGGFDAPVHISEEATNASTAVPWAIVAATMSGGILGWAVNIALVFCMGENLDNILSSQIGQPMATIFFNSFGQKGTLGIWSLIILVQFMMGTSILTASSRQTFAFSRDGALPFSSYLYRINGATGSPVNCVWFTAFGAILLGLLVFAGPSAASAIFSLSVACQYVVYSIPITARFLGGKEFVPGPFHLGFLSKPVAIIAVSWMAFALVVLMFPSSPGPHPASMNYASVVLGGVLSLAMVYYYVPIYGGKVWFRGPLNNVGDKTDDVFENSEKAQQ